MRIAIIAALAISGCANHAADYAQRMQDQKYNRCVDRIHELENAGVMFVWAQEIDACMGRKDADYIEPGSDRVPSLLEWRDKQ